MRIPVVVQYRHIHLSAADQARLFGNGPLLKPIADIGHAGQAVYRETITVIGPESQLEDVHVLGPCREETQLELSATDAFALGLKAPVRISGDVSRAAACQLVGPFGKIRSRACAIVPLRHLHCTPAEANRLGVRHRGVVTLTVVGRPGTRIEHVAVRVHPSFQLGFHLTIDEAAAFWLEPKDAVTIEHA